MSNKVIVGCKLPSGLTLDSSAGQPITLNGSNTSLIDGGVGLTHVDATEWLYLSAHYATHSAFTSGVVFSYKGSDKVADVLAIADDLVDEKTGFEGVDPSAPAPGVKPEDPAKLKQELNTAAAKRTPRIAKLSAADKAAAIEAATAQGA